MARGPVAGRRIVSKGEVGPSGDVSWEKFPSTRVGRMGSNGSTPPKAYAHPHRGSGGKAGGPTVKVH